MGEREGERVRKKGWDREQSSDATGFFLVGLTLVPVSDRRKFLELQPYYLTCVHPSYAIPRGKEIRITCSSVAFSTVNLVWIGFGPQETERRERGERLATTDGRARRSDSEPAMGENALVTAKALKAPSNSKDLIPKTANFWVIP